MKYMQRIIYNQKKYRQNPYRKLLKIGVKIVCLFLLFASVFCVFAWGEGEEYTAEHWLEKLREILPEGMSQEVNLETTEDVSRLVGFPYILSLIYGGFADKLPSALAFLASLFGMSLLGGMSSLLSDGFEVSSMKKATKVVLSAILALVLYEITAPALSRAFSAISDICRFTSLLVPIMGGIYVAGGNYTASATQSGALTWLVAEINALAGGPLRSLLSACFAFTLLGALGTGIDTAGLGKSLRQIFLTVMGVMATLFSGSLALQTALSASADSVAMRTAKYALGQMIPAVGSTVSGTLSTVAVSLELVKKAMGAGGIGILLTLLLPPLIELYLLSVSLNLAKSFCSLLGFSQGEKTFSDFKSIFDMSIGVLAISSVMLMLSLGIFMKTAIAVG